MSQFDGSVLLNTEINTDGIKAGIKDINSAFKRISEKGTDFSSSINEYNKQVLQFVENYAENLGKASASNNEFKNSIENAKNALSELEGKGLYFGDDEYDNAYLNLQRILQAVKDYKKELISPTEDANPFGLDTLSGKIIEAEQELSRLAKAGKGLGDAEFDEAYRKLAALNREAKEYRKELETPTDFVLLPSLDTYDGKIKQLENQLNSLKQAGKGLGDAEYDSVYRKLQLMRAEAKEYAAELSKTPAQIQKEAAALEASKAKEESRINALNQKLEKTRAKETQAIMEAERLKAIGDNAEISRKDIVDLNNELVALKARQAELSQAGVGLGFEEFDRNTQRISQINAQLREYSDSLTKADSSQKKMNTSLKKGNKSARGFHMGLGQVLKTTLLYGAVSRMISLVTTGIREGFENLTQYSGTTNKSLSMLMSSLTRLKNAFATAFAPILDVVAPILSRFIDMISMAATAVGQLMAALTGKSTFTRAVAVQEDYAASLEDSASAAKDAEDAMKGYLSPLDEINKISTKDDDKSGGYTGPSPGQMFEEVPVNPKFLALAGKIKNLFQPIIDAVARLKGPVMGFLSAVGDTVLWLYETILEPILTWLITSAIPRIIDILGKVLEILTIIVDWFNNNVLPVIEPIVTALVNLFIGVGDGIITVFDGIAEFLLGVFTGDWDRAFAGLGQIFSGFGQIVNSICDFIQTILETFDGWLQGVFSTDWRDTFGVLGDVLNGFFSGVESIWNGIKTFFTGIITFLRGVFSGDWRMAWEGIKQIFSGIWQTLVGVVKTPINTIIGLINGMISAIVSGLNAVIDRLNSLSFTIPSWVPKFGGNRFGLNLGHLTAPSIPYLASGAVIPPNAPFMAVLGDQRNGNNLEMPESLLRRIIREESGKGGGNETIKIPVILDGRQVFEAVINRGKRAQSANGRNPFELA